MNEGLPDRVVVNLGQSLRDTSGEWVYLHLHWFGGTGHCRNHPELEQRVLSLRSVRDDSAFRDGSGRNLVRRGSIEALIEFSMPAGHFWGRCPRSL